MFKKFEDNDISGVAQLKNTVQRGIRNKILEEYPILDDYIKKILPKKDSLKMVKCHDHIEIVINSLGEHLFFRQREGPYIPTLKLIHKYPFICPLMRVDRGAIQFLLQGANVMAPGLTSKSAAMTQDLAIGSVVTVLAEGKEHALAVGILKMEPQKIFKVNRGVAIDSVHYLNDGLWRLKSIK